MGLARLMAQSFAATVGDWCQKVPDALEIVFKETAQELVSQLDQLVADIIYDQPPASSGYKRTGFLRVSLMTSARRCRRSAVKILASWFWSISSE